MRLLDLAVVVHQEIGAVAVQHAGPPACDRSGVLLLEAVARRLDAVDFHLAVVEKRMKQPHRVRAAADAGEQRIRQPALRPRASARGSRRRSRTGNRAPSPDRDAAPRPCRCNRTCRRHWSPSRAAPRSWHPSASAPRTPPAAPARPARACEARWAAGAPRRPRPCRPRIPVRTWRTASRSRRRACRRRSRRSPAACPCAWPA